MNSYLTYQHKKTRNTCWLGGLSSDINNTCSLTTLRVRERDESIIWITNITPFKVEIALSIAAYISAIN